MIIFQSNHRVSELNVVRDTFNNLEKRKLRWTRYAVGFNIVYHIIKVGIPMSTLISCKYTGVNAEECNTVTEHRIELMLICDCIYASLLFLYEMLVMIRLICYSWKKSRLEARKHMWYFVLNSLGMLLALPLIINGMLVFLFDYDNYTTLRWVYYQDNFAKVLPSLVYIATKKNEDCFNCFNRLENLMVGIF